MTDISIFRSHSKYVLQRKIGSGGLADVYLYHRCIEGCPDQKVVLKVLRDKDETSFQELINDGEKLKQLQHPGILKALGFEKLNQGHLALVLEYVEGVTLQKANLFLSVSQNREILALYIIKKIFEALMVAHAENIIHGDISSKNVLLSLTGDIKLSDFGISSKGQKTFETLKGNPDYIHPDYMELSKQRDYFALGILFYELLSGENPVGALDLKNKAHGVKLFLEKREWEKFSHPICKILDELLLGKACHENLLLGKIKNELKFEKNKEKLIVIIDRAYKSQNSFVSKTVTLVISKIQRQTMMGLSLLRWAAGFLAFFIFLVGPTVIGMDYELRQSRQKPSYLTVTSFPWGEVFVNNKSIGYTPIINWPLKSGYQEILWRDYKGRQLKKSAMSFGHGMLYFRVK